MSKTCKKCGIEKHDDEFGVDKRTGSLNSWCRGCNRINCSKYYYEVIKPSLPVIIKRVCKEGHRYCIYCEIEKPSDQFYQKSFNACKICANKRSRERFKLKKEDIKKQAAIYRSKNKDRIKAKAAEHRKKSNHSAYSNSKAKEYRRKITDGYVIKRMRDRKIDVSAVTKELIDEWRSIIIIERIKRKIQSRGKKICAKCNKMLPQSEFAKKKFWWQGVPKYQLDNYCKPCRRVYSNERAKKRRDDTKGG